MDCYALFFCLVGYKLLGSLNSKGKFSKWQMSAQARICVEIRAGKDTKPLPPLSDQQHHCKKGRKVWVYGAIKKNFLESWLSSGWFIGQSKVGMSVYSCLGMHRKEKYPSKINNVWVSRRHEGSL